MTTIGKISVLFMVVVIVAMATHETEALPWLGANPGLIPSLQGGKPKMNDKRNEVDGLAMPNVRYYLNIYLLSQKGRYFTLC